MSYVRVVRFTDVDPVRLDALIARNQEAGAPPGGAGGPVKRVQGYVDAEQGTAVVLQFFDSAEDMATGGASFAAMDPADTPGTRVSVDACELKMDLTL